MTKRFTLLLGLLCCLGLRGQEFNLGLKFQKTHYMYWENGLSAQYSFEDFKPGQFYLGFDYVSSRLGSAIQSNALKQDRYTLSVAWYFRKDKSLRLTSKLNMGLFKVDLEEEVFRDLPQAAFLLSPELGVAYDHRELPLIFNLGVGYNIGLADAGHSPGTLQPLYYQFTISYQLYLRSANEKPDQNN